MGASKTLLTSTRSSPTVSSPSASCGTLASNKSLKSKSKNKKRTKVFFLFFFFLYLQSSHRNISKKHLYIYIPIRNELLPFEKKITHLVLKFYIFLILYFLVQQTDSPELRTRYIFSFSNNYKI